jgi:hypothetical protein
VKLSLSQRAGVDILHLDGLATAAELSVLHAGVAKLLRDGRNRIVVELAENSDLSAEILRELARLDLLGRELSGGVLIAGLTDAKIQRKVASFMKPSSLRAFARTEEAIQALTQRPSTPNSTDKAATPAEPSADDREKQRQTLLAREGGDVGALRKHIAELESVNRALLEQVRGKLIARQAIPNESAYQERIRTLEARLEELLEEASSGPNQTLIG